jgi:hypothetical protein
VEGFFFSDLSTEHLETKKQIETLRERFGEENWLHSHAGSCVQDLLGLHKTVTASSPAFLSASNVKTPTLPQSVATVSAVHAVFKILMLCFWSRDLKKYQGFIET